MADIQIERQHNMGMAQARLHVPALRAAAAKLAGTL